jgi:hypothetical protein
MTVRVAGTNDDEDDEEVDEVVDTVVVVVVVVEIVKLSSLSPLVVTNVSPWSVVPEFADVLSTSWVGVGCVSIMCDDGLDEDDALTAGSNVDKRFSSKKNVTKSRYKSPMDDS